jgi:ribosomal protein S7
MFDKDMDLESEDPQKDMKIKMLDDLIEKIMMMDDSKEEKAENPIEDSSEGMAGEKKELLDKLV